MKRIVWVMPEQRDAEFSEKLIEKIKAFAESLGIKKFFIEIKEKYIDETNPHYHFKVEFGFSNLKISSMNYVVAEYLATANKKSFSGKMEICIGSDNNNCITGILSAAAFSYYDEYLREYYSEWKTDYQSIKTI